jgi:type IV pilus assembly protein PilB
MGHEMPEYFKGMGCKACRNTGFKGRVGIHELVVVSDNLRDAIVADPTIGNLRKIAVHDNMITLSHDGFRKVREGMTTVEEIFQVVGDVATISSVES